MAFIQKNANIHLLLLLLIIGISVAGMTIYYQENFKNINTKYQTKLDELNATFTDLTKAQSVINRTKEELTLKSAREEDLSTQYLTQKEQREELQSEKTELVETKTGLESKLLNTTRELVYQKHLYADLEDENTKLEDSLHSRRDEIDNLNTEINRLRAQGCS